jgi:hypothetical protein
MWIFLFFLIISQAGFSGYLFYLIKNFGAHGNPPKKDKKDDVITLPNLKKMPAFEDIDPDSKLLKDLIESSKLENWKADIKEDYNSYHRRVWNFIITNPQKTIFIHSVLRIYDKKHSGEKVQVGYFSVQDSTRNGMSFDTGENKLQKYLITQYLWEFLLKENEEKYKENWDYYVNQKKVIEGHLTTLKRDKQLKKLFENNLEDSK